MAPISNKPQIHSSIASQRNESCLQFRFFLIGAFFLPQSTKSDTINIVRLFALVLSAYLNSSLGMNSFGYFSNKNYSATKKGQVAGGPLARYFRALFLTFPSFCSCWYEFRLFFSTFQRAKHYHTNASSSGDEDDDPLSDIGIYRWMDGYMVLWFWNKEHWPDT